MHSRQAPIGCLKMSFENNKQLDALRRPESLESAMQATVNNRDIPTTIQTLRVSAKNATVLITGETGTGKELLDAHAPCDDGLSAFLGLRPRLFGIACRMLGSAAEAEDIVQDVWVRWQTTDRSVVRNAAAFLVTTATRLAINVVHSARSRRETRVGACLPEPVDTTPDPRLRAEQGQALAVGVELLLEKLTPTERAAYILREAFDYPYRDIANALGLREANARQVVTRARHHVASGPRMTAHSSEPGRLLEAFIAAAQHGEVDDLEGVLASDVVSISVPAVAA